MIMALIIIGAFSMSQNVQAQTIYKGVDVYRYTDITDYQTLRDTGTSVLIQKATEGLTYTDGYLNYRAVTAPKYGFKVGYYHFAGNNPPVAEAQHFLSAIRGLHSDTVLWLDIEQPPKSYGWTWSKIAAINYTNQFIKYVQSQGYKIGVYSGQSFYYDYLEDNIPNVPLWLANYSQQPLQYPNRVSWQYTGTGHINGISTYADLDYFNETIFGNVIPSTDINFDNDIKQVQHNLNRVMNSRLAEDGIQGAKTTQAIINFQRIEGLTADGIAGTNTISALNEILSFPTCQYGSKGYATRYIQYRLGTSIDGVFGNQTKQAVISYQKSHGLAADGIVGQNTWKALFK